MGVTLVHDGNGTWFDPSVLEVSTVSDEMYALILEGQEHLLSMPDLMGPTPAFGYGDPTVPFADSPTLRDLQEIISVWIPGATIGEDSLGQIVIYTDLTTQDDGHLTSWDDDGAVRDERMEG